MVMIRLHSFDMESLTPHDHTTTRWVILHLLGSDHWVATWVSELVVSGTEAEKEQEILAHKALDRGYGGRLPSKLMKQTYRNIRSVEDIPAMWDEH